jgi:HEAT repeat protein
VVALLSESYNPHMRYGAAMAVGVACSGTGLKEAVAMLEPLLADAVDYVRQGALIAMAMVLVQQTEARVDKFRKQLDKIIKDKHEDVMCKMGAIMAAGILDSGVLHQPPAEADGNDRAQREPQDAQVPSHLQLPPLHLRLPRPHLRQLHLDGGQGADGGAVDNGEGEAESQAGR